MPNIPVFSTPAAAVPSAPVMPEANIAVAGGPYAQAAASGKELSSVAEQFGTKYINAKLQVDAADQSSDLSKQLQEIEFKAAKIPDRQQATTAYDADSAKVMENYKQSGANYFVKSDVVARLQAEITHRRASVQNQSFALESATARGKMDEQLNDIAKEAPSLEPRLRDIKISDGEVIIDGRVAAGMMNPEAGAKAKIDFKSNVFKGIVLNEMARDPAGGVAAFKQYESKLNAADAAQLRTHATSAEKGIAIDSSALQFLQNVPGAPGSVSSIVAPLKAKYPDIKITSEDRTVAQNTAVGGAPNSQHLQPGKAVDISLAGLSDAQKQEVINDVLSNPAVKGFGYYADHIHVDTRSGARATWGTTGANVPSWVTEKAQAFSINQPPPQTGDDYGRYSTNVKKALADYVPNGPGGAEKFHERWAVATKVSGVLGLQDAYVTSQRKDIADDFATEINKMAVAKPMTPGVFKQLQERSTASGDHSMAVMYGWYAEHEQELQNFWKMSPAEQQKYANMMPGEGGKMLKGALTENTKLRQEALKLATDAEARYKAVLGDKQDPMFGKEHVLEAVKQFTVANQPLRAQRLAEQFEGEARGFKLAQNATPAQLEDLSRAIQSIIDQGGAAGMAMVHTHKTFSEQKAANVEAWKDPVTMMARIMGRSLEPMPEDPAKLGEWYANRGNLAAQAQTVLYPNAANQIIPPQTTGEIGRFRQTLEGMGLQQLQFTAMSHAAAIPKDMIAPFSDALGGKGAAGDAFGEQVGIAMFHYNRNEPGDRVLGDKILEGAFDLKKGGPQFKDMVPHNDYRMTLATTLGGATSAMTPEARSAADNAAIALYVTMMKNNPNNGTYQGDVMAKAVQTIYGTYHKGRYGEVLLPTGIDDNAFRNGIYNLTDADLPAGAPVINGKPLTAAMVKDDGKLVTVGDGKYKVQFPIPNRSGMTDIQELGKPYWTIDIRKLAARGINTSIEPSVMDFSIGGVR